MVVISIPTTISKEFSSTTFATCVDTKSTVLLEFQGAVEKDGASWAGNTLGQLSILEGGVKAQLIIGNHRLEGKVIKLDKPLLLIQKQPGVRNAAKHGQSSVGSLGVKDKDKSSLSALDGDDTSASTVWPNDQAEDTGAGGVVDPMIPTGNQDRIQYDTVAIIRQKILFSTMPAPIIHAERRGLTTIRRGV
ncbi:MAG: hypothetical protein J3Q66DRAFT_404203 [Benniella sp.]|nr:MAG: hypothetical protein J3Q66DRAFT_404203 [Benniella sp.]